MTLEELI